LIDYLPCPILYTFLNSPQTGFLYISGIPKPKAMKKLILLLFLLPYIVFGQTTAIPDTAFEQALIDFGYDNVIDSSVLTANISSVTGLSIPGFPTTPFSNQGFNQETAKFRKARKRRL